ncbi:hypothetical protein ACXYMO_14660 [Arenibacterium sp. CAU 1754]
MKFGGKLGWALIASLLAWPVGAADFSDPTWPCVQRKVENLSVGIMWPYPIEDVDLSPAAEQDVQDIVSRLILRRFELEEIRPLIVDFAATHGNDQAIMGHIFSETFDRLSTTRKTIMKGIEEYSQSQIAMSERIDATRKTMTDLMRADDPDYDKVDALEEQLDWDERIYTDRAQSLIYVCETPVLLEKRLYAIAQMLIAETQQ